MIVLFTLVFCSLMELSHRQFWSDNFDAFQPHYSELQNIPDSSVSELDGLNFAKTIICAYVVVFALLLQISHYLVLPVVLILGSPFILCYYCNLRKEERSHGNQASKADS